MLPRALAPIVVCALVLWPLRVLACINSMDATRDFSQSYWPDLIVWSTGAVLMNRIVLRNVFGTTAPGQGSPSASRRGIFLFVGVALLLILEAVSVGGPLLNFSANDFSQCSLSISNAVALVAAPLLLFVVQAALFHGLGRRYLGDRGAMPVVALVLTSVALVLGLGSYREEVTLPFLCDNPKLGFAHDDGYGY